MKDLLHIVFEGLKFNIEKLKEINCRMLGSGEYYIWKELKCVKEVSLQLHINRDGSCRGEIFDEDFGQYFPDTKDVCFEVLEILNEMQDDGLIK